jgi:hydrogenase-4 membrane subunit HyfE
MKNRLILVMAILSPFLLVIILAISGITFNAWVYIILGITCPVVAGIVWFLYKGMERKVSAIEKERGNSKFQTFFIIFL